MSILQQLSDETSAMVDSMRDSIVTVGSGKASPRTGIVIGKDEVVTVAMAADDGESVPVHHGERELEGTVTAFDSASGVALLSVPGLDTPVKPATDLPKLGDLTITVAAPIPGDVEARLSMIRCVDGPTRLPGGRRVEHYIQTDAARFRGFSASVVVNHRSEAVGMTMPVHRREEAYVLPMSEIAKIVEELRSGERVGTGYLGVQTTPVALPVAADGTHRGLLVTGVEEDCPAERAGITVGSFIIKVGETATPTVEDLFDALVGVRAGQRITVTIADSDGTTQTRDIEVVLRS